MKPELEMDFLADAFVYPWITRQQLAQIVHRFKERAFAEKLQTFLHDPKCGKHSLRFLEATGKYNDQSQACLKVTDRFLYTTRFNECELPETEMPENITSFKWISIRLFDDEVLDFLTKIKSLFTNVHLELHRMYDEQTAAKMRFILGHILPMCAGIRAIRCTNDGVELLESHFPGTLAQAKELELVYPHQQAFIPTYLHWLYAPLNFDVDGPRFLIMRADSDTIVAIVNTVRQHFLAATTTSTFVIFLEFDFYKSQFRAEEQTTKNAATKEELTVRNAICKKPDYSYESIHYVEIMRHPAGADAKMQEWIEQRAYYEKRFNNEQRMISIGGPTLTIGHITKKEGIDQAEDEPADDAGDEAVPSTSAMGMEKK